MDYNFQVINIKDHKQYKHAVLDSKTISICVGNIDVYEEDLDKYSGLLSSVGIGGKYKISVGDMFKVKLGDRENNYKVNYILKSESKYLDPKSKNNKTYYFKTHLNNLTSKYLLPCYGLPKGFFSYEGYMINAYLNRDRESLDVLYRFVSDDHYKQLEKSLCEHDLYSDTKDINSEYVIHRFKIPSIHLEDVDRFLNGKYSKFSTPLKIKIMKFHKCTSKSNLYGILNKSNWLKEKIEKTLNIDLYNSELEDRPNTDEFFNEKYCII